MQPVVKTNEYEQLPKISRMFCPVCESSAGSQHFFSGQDRLFGVAGTFEYVRCNACSTVYQDPCVVKEAIRDCYPRNFYGVELDDVGANERVPAQTFPSPEQRVRTRLRLAVIQALESRPQQGIFGAIGWMLSRSRFFRERSFQNRLLDEMLPRDPNHRRALEIGCGHGYLLKELAHFGWDVEGNEWDPLVCAAARRRSKGHIWVGDFINLPMEPCSYDLVIMNHVIEHVHDVRASLCKIESVLAKGGKVVIIYPNSESLGCYYYGKDWVNWDPPRHLVLPPSKALTALAKSVGLSLISRRSRAPYVTEHFTQSRAIRNFGRAGEECLTRCDRVAIRVEKLLVNFGFVVGEEVILVFGKQR